MRSMRSELTQIYSFLLGLLHCMDDDPSGRSCSRSSSSLLGPLGIPLREAVVPVAAVDALAAVEVAAEAEILLFSCFFFFLICC